MKQNAEAYLQYMRGYAENGANTIGTGLLKCIYFVPLLCFSWIMYIYRIFKISIAALGRCIAFKQTAKFADAN